MHARDKTPFITRSMHRLGGVACPFFISIVDAIRKYIFSNKNYFMITNTGKHVGKEEPQLAANETEPVATKIRMCLLKTITIRTCGYPQAC